MKKISIIIITLLILVLCGCENKNIYKESTVMSIDKLKELYAKDSTNTDLACKLIEALLLNDSKVEAYETLRYAQEKTNSIEDIEKLREFCKYLPIRLVEIDYYDDDGKQNDAKLYRYDENGRIISNGDETYFYPDDGGDVYYYTLSSWYGPKKSYDKNDVLLYEETTYYKSKYEYSYDEKGRVIKSKNTMKADYGNSTETKEIEYDNQDNVIKIKTVYKSENYNSNAVLTYEYDDHNNITRELSKRGDYTDDIKYQNDYDEYGFLIRHFGKSGNENSYDYYEIENNYEYDVLYGVKVKEQCRTVFYETNAIYVYELVDPNSIYVGLPNEDMIAFVSGEATKAVINREITADKIKIRSLPTTKDKNQTGTARKGEVYKVYNSVYNDGYVWHEIGENQWIADDGTWTKEVE